MSNKLSTTVADLEGNAAAFARRLADIVPKDVGAVVILVNREGHAVMRGVRLEKHQMQKLIKSMNVQGNLIIIPN